jgi:hypothetical protein
LLRALASLGLLNETPGRQFNLTERGAVLRTDAPGSLRYKAMLEGGPEHSAIWKHVPAMVRDGCQNAFMREYGRLAFDHPRANPDGYGGLFCDSVRVGARGVARLRPLSVATGCDVGGSHGHMMCSFLTAYPHLSGTVLDLPEVDAASRKENYRVSISNCCVSLRNLRKAIRSSLSRSLAVL